MVSKICFQDPSSYGKKLVLLKPRQMGLFPFTLNKQRNGRLSETVPFSVLYSETMEIKEDVQAGQVTEHHHADVTSRRSGWQPWKCNIPYRLATAFVAAASWRRYQLLGSSVFRCQLEFCFKNAAELRFSRPSFWKKTPAFSIRVRFAWLLIALTFSCMFCC